MDIARWTFGALVLIATPQVAAAQDRPEAHGDQRGAAASPPHRTDIIVTAVARGRDRLDSAVSTSSLRESEILKITPRSTAEIFRDIPGVRSESSGGEGLANISIRGLPMATGGAKFLQLQEDGLPVLEFGDINFGNADIFLRADLTLASIESIRGGSASTFSSNSPGGVINLVSKTGETPGGIVQATTGLDYNDHRLDATYGGALGGGLRFQIGGFYHQGEGLRHIGYDSNRGGQIKVNVTKSFANGYLRLYGKWLDDRTAAYLPNPVRVTGSGAHPRFEDLPDFAVNHDVLLSRYDTTDVTLDGQNRLAVRDLREGQHPVVKAIGFETQTDLSAFTVTERFRYADISGNFLSNFPAAIDTVGGTATAIGGAGAVARYATGPARGRPVGAQPGGNGLIARNVVFDVALNSLANVTNDLRVSRVDAIGKGSLTTTAGFYTARQTVDTDWLWTATLMEVRGGGRAALVDVFDGQNRAMTQDGYFGYGASWFGDCCRRGYRVDYAVNAPFGSLNYKIGRVALGASVRYDYGRARGSIYGAELGDGRVGLTSFDINGDGLLSDAERRVAILPLTRPAPVDYRWHYLSYSTGINVRIAEPLAVFARYSRGARAGADRLLFGTSVSPVDGSLVRQEDAVNFVYQAEAGVKYRTDPLTVNVTGFHASTEEQNYELTSQRFINRRYRANGVEIDGVAYRGPFTLTAGATYTDARIVQDTLSPASVGRTPRRQAALIVQATPELSLARISIGANVVGTTGSYAQDIGDLRLPGFTQVNGFAQWRWTDRLLLSLNANNLFDVHGFTEAEEHDIPANGIVRARSITGRTTSLTLRVTL